MNCPKCKSENVTEVIINAFWQCRDCNAQIQKKEVVERF